MGLAFKMAVIRSPAFRSIAAAFNVSTISALAAAAFETPGHSIIEEYKARPTCHRPFERIQEILDHSAI
jgi:hypothetical protein